MCSYGDVPEDVIGSIFERLPIKSLLRFRSLSKYWCSRIASPDFIHNYPLCSDQKVLIRHLIRVTNVKYIDMYTLHSPRSFGYIKPGVELDHSINLYTVGSCNGIICLWESGISLWNFSIRRKLTLPRHPSLKDTNVDLYNATFGFGFDPVTHDYKVVAIPYFRYIAGVAHNDDSFIYSLKTNSWDSIISSPTTPFIYAFSKACFFNGTLHWLVIGLVHEPPTRTRIIMTFNLCTHAFGTISLPISFGKTGEITTINGYLAVVSLKDGYNRIWVMSEHDNAKSWSVYLKVKAYDRVNSARVLQPIINGKILIYDFDRLQVYNPETKLVTELLKFRHRCHRDMENYVESLELLDKGTTCGETIFSWMKESNGERIRVSELLENEYSCLSY